MARVRTGRPTGRPRKRVHAQRAALAIERGDYDNLLPDAIITKAALDHIRDHFPHFRDTSDDAFKMPGSNEAESLSDFRKIVRQEYVALRRMTGLRQSFGPDSRLSKVMSVYRSKRDAAQGDMGSDLMRALAALGWVHRKPRD